MYMYHTEFTGRNKANIESTMGTVVGMITNSSLPKISTFKSSEPLNMLPCPW